MNKPIKENAPVKSVCSIEITASVERVWQILTAIHEWPLWQASVTETKVLGEVKEGTQFNWKAGGIRFKSIIHTAHPLTEFGWTGSTLGANAIHNWIFEKKENSTVVIVQECLDGLLPRLFRSYFQKNLDAGMMKNLQELKAAAENSTI